MIRALIDLIKNVPLEDENIAIEQIAQRMVAERMGTAAILFLETSKPISFIAGQAVLVASPFIGGFIPPQRLERYSELFSDRAFIERIIVRVEELESENAGKAPLNVEK